MSGQPPEMLLVIAKDKFLREEILIPAVSKKFTFIRFSLQFNVIVIMSGWSCKEGEGGDDDEEEHQENGEEEQEDD